MPGNPVRRKPDIVDLDAPALIPGGMTRREWLEQDRRNKAAMEAYLATMPKGDILDYVRTPFNVMGNSMAGLGAEIIGKGKQFEEKYAWTPKTRAEMEAVEAMMKVMGPPMDLMDYLKIPAIGPGLPTLASAMQGVDTAAVRLSQKQAAEAAKRAGQAAKGAVKDLATSEPAYNLMNKVAAATGAAPKQIMMGPNSKTWNQAKADLAVQMERQGKDPMEIWEATGTFRAADGKLRQEIPDFAMTYSPVAARRRQTDQYEKRRERSMAAASTPEEQQNVKDYYKKELQDAIYNVKGKASEFIDHPELRAAYPELFDRPFKQLDPTNPDYTASERSSGFFQPETKTIVLNGDFPQRDLRDTTLHELQHAVQQIEGWQGGASPSLMAAKMAERDALKYSADKERELLTLLAPKAKIRPLTEQSLKDIEGKLEKYKQLEGIDDPFKAYERVSGEEEARAVESRSRFDNDRLKEWLPHDNYDTPFDQHITDFATGGIVHMNKGGILGRIAKTAEKGLERATKGAQQVLPAAERAANLEAFLAKSQVKEPLYHATPKDIKAFKPGGDDPTMSGRAIWTTTSKTKQPAQHNIGSRSQEFREGVNVMPLHGRAERPLMLDDPGMVDWAQEVFAGGSKEFPELLPDQWLKEVKDAGYDSVILADPHKRGDPHEVIFFEPTQLKSALGNRGTYDIDDPDLNKAQGGEVRAAKGGLLGALAKTAEKGLERAAKAVPVAQRAIVGAQEILPTAEREANLAKFLEESKVPKRVYHGTKSKQEIKSFDPSKIGSATDQGYLGRGFYFDDYLTANVYAGFNSTNPENSISGGSVYPVHLSIKNPVELKNRIEGRRQVDRELLAREFAGLPKSATADDLRAKFIEMGHDGVIFDNNGVKEYVAFEPTQIKSALGNRGTYDINDPDITKASGGEVRASKGGLLGALAKTAEKGLEAAAKGAKVAVKAAPQDEALRLAQLRAALPPAQGGLGLPANNTPMDRANAMEFNYVRRSRNPSGPFNDVNYAMFLEHKGDVDDALDKLRSFGKGQWLGRAEVPVEKIQKDIVRSIKKRKLNEPYQATAASLAREANPNDIVNAGGIWDAPEIAESIIEDAAEKGIGGILTNDGAIIWDPDLIRSREAAFDPWRKDAATAAAFGVAAPDLLAKEQEPEDRLTIDEFLKQMKER